VNGPSAREFRHDGLFYRSDDELVAAAAPFLRDGLAASETVVVVCAEPRASALVDALPGDGGDLLVLRPTELYRRTATTIAALQKLAERELANGRPGVRVMGEIDFGDDPEGKAEWSAYEAVINAAFAHVPMLWTVCAFNTRDLPEEVISAATQTHPHLLTATTRTPNPNYLEPAQFLRRSAAGGPGWLPPTPPDIDIPSLADVGQLRGGILGALEHTGLDIETRHHLVFAANEVATNAFDHGRPPVRVRLWCTPSRVICTVTDSGDGFDDRLAGYTRIGEARATAAAGLWTARQLVDHLDAARTGQGFTVRMILRSSGST
jgi:anti-sigma regulatory factor (Ser/Thr protein kinase)